MPLLLGVFAVVSFGIGHSEKALLEYFILSVPQGEAEAEPATAVGDAQETVLPPTIGAGARLLVGEMVPSISAFGVVLPNSPPLALGKVGAPAAPVLPAQGVAVEPFLFRGRGVHGWMLLGYSSGLI
jgi:hypothetical protein